jgi:hypothetical protein
MKIEALCALTFDHYGTLFNKETVSILIDELVPGRGLTLDLLGPKPDLEAPDLMALADQLIPVPLGATGPTSRRAESP